MPCISSKIAACAPILITAKTKDNQKNTNVLFRCHLLKKSKARSHFLKTAYRNASVPSTHGAEDFLNHPAI